MIFFHNTQQYEYIVLLDEPGQFVAEMYDGTREDGELLFSIDYEESVRMFDQDVDFWDGVSTLEYAIENEIGIVD